MAGIFLKIVNMSISACWIVLAIILLRFALKKAPKWLNCVFWGIAGLRLVLPFSFESIFSLIPSAETITKAPDSPRPHIDSGISIIDNQINGYLQGNYFEGVSRPMGNFVDITTILAIVWVIGIVALLIYTLVSFLRLKSKIRTAVLLRDNIYQSEAVVSPFVLGVIKPKIYLPFNMNDQDMDHVIAHEQAHLRRKDHLWKPLGFLILTLHWFNPMVWFGYILLCRDIELACDEKVVKELNNEQRADYSQALLTCSVNRRMIAACPLAFGEVGVKDRVKSVLNYKKPAFWIIVVAIITSIAVAVCFLTNPKKNNLLDIERQQSGSDLTGVSLEIISSDLSAPDPFIELEWVNDTSNNLLFGEAFTVFYNENGNWENCSIDKNPVWHLIGYLIEPESTTKKTYKLNGQIMTQPGKYRFETSFNIDGQAEPKYKAWIEFELAEGIDGITVHTFKPIELVYDDGMYSFVQTADAAPTYMIVNSMQLLEKIDGNVSEPIGTFEEITLNKDNFDSRFRGNIDYSWLGSDTLKSLKDNNKRIWQLYGDASAETPRLYILLEQKDGTFYLGHGYYNCNSTNPTNSDDSHIRWLYKVSENVVSSEVTISTQLPEYTGNEIISEPPALIVISNEQSMEAIKGTSSWICEDKNGISKSTMSDSSHPLLLKESMPILDLLPSYLGHVDPLDARLQFNAKGITPICEVPPDKIEIRCWEEKHWGNTNAKSEDIKVNIVNENIFFKLKDGKYVYEIIATWNSNEKFSGTVRYSFCTNKANFNLDSYPKIGVNSKIKSTYNQTATEMIEKAYDKEDFVFTKTHYQMDDGLWVSGGYAYMYRLEITGKLNNAAKNTTYIVLSNRKNVTFDETWKASGLSSNTADYFDPTDAVIVGHKLFD